jgi:hypothetical protein
MKKKNFEAFEGHILKLDNQNSLSGGTDPGYATDTSECTWNINYLSGNTSADTERDGDWVDACGSEHGPVS